MDKISALIDGELDEDEIGSQFSRIKKDEVLRERWDLFHLIGDALRDDYGPAPYLDRRIAERLALEPTVLAPRRSTARRVTAYALSAVASLSAVALVAWVAFSANPLNTPPQEIARASIPAVPAATPVTAAVASIPDQGNVNEYLLAHQGFSPSTAIQGVLPYIRTVSDSHAPQNR